LTAASFNKNGTRKLTNLVFVHLLNYFVLTNFYCTQKYSEFGIKEMLEFLIYNNYVVYGDQVLQQSIGIPMCTNCAPLLKDLFSYSYEAEFVQNFMREKKKTLAVVINSTFR
jgi:hypothetical protein